MENKADALAIATERLTIRELRDGDAEDIWRNSLDEDNRRYVPDEVFETLKDAQKTVSWLVKAAQSDEGPFVCPIINEQGSLIGYVQLCPIPEGWEVGYHIAKPYTGRGYATEAVRAFVPAMMDRMGLLEVWGIALEENAASHRVLVNCGFQLIYCGMGDYQGERRALRRYRYCCA